MKPEDQAAFCDWYNEQPTPTEDDWIPCKVPPHEIWQAALAHRDAQASAVNQQMLEALKQAEESIGRFVSEEGSGQIDFAILDNVTSAIAAAEAKGGV